MNKSFGLILTTICISVLLSGCIRKSTIPEEVVCPVPAICKPESFSGVAPSLGKVNKDSKGKYKVVKNITSVNDATDQWQLAFTSDDSAYLTSTVQFSNTELMKPTAYSVRDKATFVGKKRLPDDGKYHYGFPFMIDNNLYGSIAIQKTSIKGDGGEIGIDTLPGLSYFTPITIGQSSLAFENIQRVFNRKSLAYWVSHFSPGPENIVFFASDIEGGYGGTDLYYTTLTNGKLGVPVNLGPEINTPCNELSPYYDKYSDKFMFSSVGHSTVGGFDIFNSEIEVISGKVSLSSPLNAGLEINTEHNELFPSTTKNERYTLYFSSNRPGGAGGYDMYAFFEANVKEIDQFASVDNQEETEPKEIEEPDEVKEDIKEDIKDFPVIDTIVKITSSQTIPDTVKLNITGTVEDELGNPVEKAVITAKKINSAELMDSTTTTKNGKFDLEVETDSNVVITAQSDQEFYKANTIDISDLEGEAEIESDFILPSTLNIRINFPNDVADKPYDFVLDSLGKTTSTRWQTSMDELASHIKRYRSSIESVSLIGHTDTKGTAAYNRNLAKKRADFVAEQLYLRGISKKLITVDGKGESSLLTKLQGESKDQYESRLRRVEIKKVRK